jgi:hypothetical protein
MLTCQQALVNTAQADGAGTRSAVTSMSTPLGWSIAALMMAFRNSR